MKINLLTTIFLATGLTSFFLLQATGLNGQVQAGSPGTGDGYTIYPLFQSGDVLLPAKNCRIGGRYEATAVGPDGLVFQCEKGVFYVTPDTVLPLLTSFDTIPGTGEYIADFWKEGQSWSPGLEAMFKFGIIALQISEVGDVRVVFYYIKDRRINFYRASPGKVEKLFDFPDKLMIGEVEFTFSDPFDGIWGLAYGEPQGRPSIGIFWHKMDLWVEKNNKIALFVYDGEKVVKLAAKGDLVNGTGEKIRFIGESKYDQQVLWNDELTACYFRATCPGDNGYALYYSDRGQIKPILRKGQKLTGKEEIPYRPFLNISAWVADFRVPTAYICLSNQDFIAVTDKESMRFPGWRAGAQLPGTSGGTIYNFGVTREMDNGSILLNHPFFVFPDKKEMVAWIDIFHSETGIKEGIFSCIDGEITKLVAQKDAAPPDVGGSLKTFTDFNMVNHKDIVFLSTLKDSNAGSGIFLLSDGILTTVITDKSALPVTDQYGNALTINLEEVKITGMQAYDSHTVYFSASWTGGSGYFMAVQESK